MIYIYKDRIINIQWTVMKGTSQVRENFDRALLKMFLIGPHEKYLLEATAEEGVVSAEVPSGLPEGTYSVELIYVKNWQSLQRPPEIHKHHPVDCRFNSRCIMRSRKDDLFAITEYETESENIGHGEVIVRLKTSVASYGYDGLSAYEIAVMRGDFTGSEGEWMDTVGRSINMYFYSYLGNAKDTRLQVPSYLRRKGLIITYVNDNGIVVTERYKGDAFDDTAWGDDDNWDNLFDTSDYVKANNAYGFNVTAFGINGGRHTINTAIIDVPHKMRVLGHKITFAQHDGTWATYQLQAMSLSDYINPDKWVKLEGINNTGSIAINNQPDEEDITVDKDSLLKFADKEYNENSFSGLGRVYIRKNIVGDKNVLTQDMVCKENAIYIIQYDYDLNNQTIDIPANCTLDYKNGGNFSNGILNCNNTTIRIDNFDSLGVSLTGTYTVVEALNEDKSPYMNDTEYNVEEHSGLGHVYLRKNKGVLTQNNFNKSNTIYHIRYDYDLQGDEITIPANSELRFNGGNIKNGSLTLQNTLISGSPVIDAILKGTINNKTIYTNWFISDDSLFSTLNLINGYNEINFESKEYVQNTAVIFKPSNLKIIGNGAIINSYIQDGHAFRNINNNYASKKVIISAPQGSNILTLDSTTDLKRGDILALRDEKEYSWSSYRSYYTQGEFAVIDDIVGSTVLLVSPIQGEYINTDTIFAYKMVFNTFEISNLTINMLGAAESEKRTYGLGVYTSISAKVSNVKIVNAMYGLVVYHSYLVDISNCETITNKIYTDSEDNYGILISNCQNVNINKCICSGGNHGIALGGSGGYAAVITRYVRIEDCTCLRTEIIFGSDFNSHGNTENTRWIRCIGHAISLGGKNDIVEDCEFYPGTEFANGAITLTERKDLNIKVKNCTIHGIAARFSFSNSNYKQEYYKGNIYFENNKIYASEDLTYVIFSIEKTDNAEHKDLILDGISMDFIGNTIYGVESNKTKAHLRFDAINSVNIQGNKFINTYTRIRANNYIFLKNNEYIDSTINSILSAYSWSVKYYEISGNTFIIDTAKEITSNINVLSIPSLEDKPIHFDTVKIANNTIIFNGNAYTKAVYAFQVVGVTNLIYTDNIVSGSYDKNEFELICSSNSAFKSINNLYLGRVFNALHPNELGYNPLRLQGVENIIIGVIPNNNNNALNNIVLATKHSDFGKNNYIALIDTDNVVTAGAGGMLLRKDGYCENSVFNVRSTNLAKSKNIICKDLSLDTLYVASNEDLSLHKDLDGFTPMLKRGSKGNRPTPTENDFGFEYYDTTLKKKILWNGTEWTNLDGTPLA